MLCGLGTVFVLLQLFSGRSRTISAFSFPLELQQWYRQSGRDSESPHRRGPLSGRRPRRQRGRRGTHSALLRAFAGKETGPSRIRGSEQWSNFGSPDASLRTLLSESEALKKAGGHTLEVCVVLPRIIVIDTNVVFHSLLESLFSAIKGTGSRIFLPEVVQKELFWIVHTSQKYDEKVKKRSLNYFYKSKSDLAPSAIKRKLQLLGENMELVERESLYKKPGKDSVDMELYGPPDSLVVRSFDRLVLEETSGQCEGCVCRANAPDPYAAGGGNSKEPMRIDIDEGVPAVPTVLVTSDVAMRLLASLQPQMACETEMQRHSHWHWRFPHRKDVEGFVRDLEGLRRASEEGRVRLRTHICGMYGSDPACTSRKEGGNGEEGGGAAEVFLVFGETLEESLRRRKEKGRTVCKDVNREHVGLGRQTQVGNAVTKSAERTSVYSSVPSEKTSKRPPTRAVGSRSADTVRDSAGGRGVQEVDSLDRSKETVGEQEVREEIVHRLKVPTTKA
mmetsp:Transcript_52424/g.102594  ORF Transcript_52424/g.102594 Transcript_52424/m.102594 type:complete len:505 (-) Transcript_52424:72-1586(-)